MLSKVLVIGFLTVIISVIIKQYKPELSMIINICGGIIIVFLFVDQLWLILNEIIVLGDQSGIAHNILMSVIKVIIASYITEFCVAYSLGSVAGDQSDSVVRGLPEVQYFLWNNTLNVEHLKFLS